jgi:phage shock protein E
MLLGLVLSGWALAAPVEWPVAKAEQELQERAGQLQVLDVRTKEEFKDGHLAGAKLIPWTDDDFRERAVKELDQEKPLFVYCRSGKRSGEAAKALEKLGFKQIFTLVGGTLAWDKEGRPLVRPE